MPEGDTLYALAARLRPMLTGKILSRTDFRVPRLATVDLAGWQVDEVRSIGKHLIIEVSDEQKRLAIRSHLGMEGMWRWFAAGQRWTKPGHTARVVLGTADAEAVGFALRELNVDVDPYSSDGTYRQLAHLGPDLLGPNWDADRAQANIATAISASKDRSVSDVLLDQRVMAGVGNIYRNEICFLLGAHPSLPMRAVDAAKAVALSRKLLWDNRNRPRNTTGLRGRANHWVYGRIGQPCRRCGTPITKVLPTDPNSRDRVTYFCATCQPPSASP